MVLIVTVPCHWYLLLHNPFFSFKPIKALSEFVGEVY